MEPTKPQPPPIIDVPATVTPVTSATPVEAVRPTRLDEPPPHPGGAPVHPLAALLMLIVDNLWNLADWAVISLIITVPLCFFTVFVPSFFIQRFLMKNRAGRAFVLALLLGTVAAVPTSITGTPVGVALLAWTGISRLLGKPMAR